MVRHAGAELRVRSAPLPLILRTRLRVPAQDVYAIPAEMLAGGAFCYAGKAHPELERSAEEIVFSFMCNTPTIAALENRTDIYVPQLVRTRIL